MACSRARLKLPALVVITPAQVVASERHAVRASKRAHAIALLKVVGVLLRVRARPLAGVLGRDQRVLLGQRVGVGRVLLDVALIAGRADELAVPLGRLSCSCLWQKAAKE